MTGLCKKIVVESTQARWEGLRLPQFNFPINRILLPSLLHVCLAWKHTPINFWHTNLYLKFVSKDPTCNTFSFAWLGPHPQNMEVPRLGVESELQLPAYAAATAMWDPSQVCNLHHSSWQCRIPNSPSKARDRTCFLMDTSQIHFHRATAGIPNL